MDDIYFWTWIIISIGVIVIIWYFLGGRHKYQFDELNDDDINPFKIDQTDTRTSNDETDDTTSYFESSSDERTPSARRVSDKSQHSEFDIESGIVTQKQLEEIHNDGSNSSLLNNIEHNDSDNIIDRRDIVQSDPDIASDDTTQVTMCISPDEEPINITPDVGEYVDNDAQVIAEQCMTEESDESIATQQRWASKGERACAEALRRIFGKKFHTIRPDWLINPSTGRRLEIDCANMKLGNEVGINGVGVEYQGAQHYIYPNCFHRTREQFEKQVQRDEIKREICNKRRFFLIPVPYNVKFYHIEDYIRNKIHPSLRKFIVN